MSGRMFKSITKKLKQAYLGNLWNNSFKSCKSNLDRNSFKSLDKNFWSNSYKIKTGGFPDEIFEEILRIIP